MDAVLEFVRPHRTPCESVHRGRGSVALAIDWPARKSEVSNFSARGENLKNGKSAIFVLGTVSF